MAHTRQEEYHRFGCTAQFRYPLAEVHSPLICMLDSCRAMLQAADRWKDIRGATDPGTLESQKERARNRGTSLVLLSLI